MHCQPSTYVLDLLYACIYILSQYAMEILSSLKVTVMRTSCQFESKKLSFCELWKLPLYRIELENSTHGTVLSLIFSL